jgi:hypothetical protein
MIYARIGLIFSMVSVATTLPAGENPKVVMMNDVTAERSDKNGNPDDMHKVLAARTHKEYDAKIGNSQKFSYKMELPALELLENEVRELKTRGDLTTYEKINLCFSGADCSQCTHYWCGSSYCSLLPDEYCIPSSSDKKFCSVGHHIPLLQCK